MHTDPSKEEEDPQTEPALRSLHPGKENTQMCRNIQAPGKAAALSQDLRTRKASVGGENGEAQME